MDVGVLFQFCTAYRLHSFAVLIEIMHYHTHWLRVKHVLADGYASTRLQWVNYSDWLLRSEGVEELSPQSP